MSRAVLIGAGFAAALFVGGALWVRGELATNRAAVASAERGRLAAVTAQALAETARREAEALASFNGDLVRRSEALRDLERRQAATALSALAARAEGVRRVTARAREQNRRIDEAADSEPGRACANSAPLRALLEGWGSDRDRRPGTDGVHEPATGSAASALSRLP